MKKSANLPEDYIPTVYEIIKSSNKITKHPMKPLYASNIDYPKFSLGFHHFIHQSTDKTIVMFKKDHSKKRYIMNKFETTVNDYQNDIANTSQKYFNTKDKFGNQFYNMWEMLFMFDIIDPTKSNFSSIHLNKLDTDFAQATKHFLKLFGKKEKNGKGGKATLVTANKVLTWRNHNTKEQEAFALLLGEIYDAIRVQAPGGNFVLRIFESFTYTTNKIISILSTLYNKVYITKPLTSVNADSGKYVVCLGFKGGKLDKLSPGPKNKYLVDIFPDYEINELAKSTAINYNTDIGNKQFIMINKMITFIEKQNFRGEVYNDNRNMQIDASAFWIKTFFPPHDKVKKTIGEVREFVGELIKENSKKSFRMKEIISE